MSMIAFEAEKLSNCDLKNQEFRLMTTTAGPKSKKEDKLVLKGGVFTLTTLVLQSAETIELEQYLTEKINIAPKFFYYAPVVIDCSALDQSENIEFKAITQLLKKHKLIPVGVRGVKPELQNDAIQHDLAIMPESRHAREKPLAIAQEVGSDTSKAKVNAVQIDASSTSTRLISQPVRSGQQIYAPGGDLLVLASVSHGAELLADGNIYVFGPLRGRALAGISGDQSAMIFCKSLEAELVSIAGQYKISEDLKETHWKEAVRIQLKNERLHFSEL